MFCLPSGLEQSSSSSQNFEDYEVNDFDILTIGSKYGLSLHLKQQKEDKFTDILTQLMVLMP